MLNGHLAITLSNTRTNDSLQEDLREQDTDDGSPIMRDIHALTPPRASRDPPREAFETSSQRSSSLSIASSGENFTTMSREFSALVLAGSTVVTDHPESASSNLDMIREDENPQVEINPLAIVMDTSSLGPTQSPRGGNSSDSRGIILGSVRANTSRNEVSVQHVKKEEVVSKISAWENSKLAKINNRFKREDAIINGWEGEQVQKASSWMKKVERKLEEKRARAQEKMQNDIAKAHRKAEEKRASAEAIRGTKVARILEIANLMRAVGRPPVKRSFF